MTTITDTRTIDEHDVRWALEHIAEVAPDETNSPYDGGCRYTRENGKPDCIAANALAVLMAPLPTPRDTYNTTSIRWAVPMFRAELGVDLTPEATVLLARVQRMADNHLPWGTCVTRTLGW